MARLPLLAQVPGSQQTVLFGHCTFPAGQSGAGVVEVVVGAGGGGGGIVGLVRASRASAPSPTTSVAMAAPPSPSRLLNTVRRDAPWPNKRVS
ncbi:MAG: hypothetical protein IT335_06510 [Thermomicrobiales bacterium]|nr:hypothetical protein [Thermomicrobiales bacterium]